MTAVKTWWQARDNREQLLLKIMAASVGLFLIYMLVIRPIGQKHEALTQQLEAANIEAELVAAAVSEASRTAGTQSSVTPVSTAEFRVVISRSAQEKGVTLTRLQPDQNGGLNIWADDVNTPVLYTWLLALQQDHGIYVARASLQNSNANGSIRAQILLRNGGAG